ncbi:hypothetical protein FSO04_18685 [Paraburkholderia madseniana]|uniref:Fis family transcriptional regulator n=1 Tax=Paraburkholderia madseniana TaxID=2599607 RepID=A0A6N6WCP3_9BURK|nr:hypothetical protein [Paraburkholderia madseniana]KAE8758422.1 hypothetical protein FSO04_18685 [Paraburkholderia madseniana]
MSQNRKKRLAVGQSRRKPLSKTMLLPLPAISVRELVLHHHLALAAFRVGKGNGGLLVELVKALYMAWYLQEDGFGAAEHELYLEAERILDAASRNASDDIWLIEVADCPSITRILDLYEQQLSSAPVYVVNEARARLRRFGESDKRSPW